MKVKESIQQLVLGATSKCWKWYYTGKITWKTRKYTRAFLLYRFLVYKFMSNIFQIYQYGAMRILCMT